MLGLGLGKALCDDSLALGRILSEARDLIGGSTRIFSRASERHSVHVPGTVLAIDQPDEVASEEIWPGYFARSFCLHPSYTRVNDRNPAANSGTDGGLFTVDGVEPSKFTWSQTAPGAPVMFWHTLTISNNAGYYFQCRVAKNTTGRVRFRVRDSGGADFASCDFDLVTGTIINDVRGGVANHDFDWKTVVDMGSEWAVMVRWRAATSDGTTGSNGRMQMWLTDDAGDPNGASIPNQVISFVQMNQNFGYPPYVPGAGKPVACAADSLTLDPLPINFDAAGEIWAIVMPNRWGAPYTQGGGNRYLFGWGPLDPPSTEPWRTIGLNITTAAGGQAEGGGNLGRGNGGGASPSSASAYSGAQGNYWRTRRRQYLGGSWNRTRVQVVFDALSVDGAATHVEASLPVAAQPPRTFTRLNLYPYGSASSPSGDVCVIGWPRQLTSNERTALSRSLIRTQEAEVYP